MPGAARNRGRRRAAAGDSGRGVRTEEYVFIERRDGVRIEHPLRPTVDLRIDGRDIAIHSPTEHTRCSLFTASVRLARLVAGALLARSDRTEMGARAARLQRLLKYANRRSRAGRRRRARPQPAPTLH